MRLLLIPALPLLSFAILILLGRRLKKWSALVSLAALLGSLCLSVGIFRQLFNQTFNFHSPTHLTWAWLPQGEHPIQLGLLADPLSITMCLVVTVIGWLIMLYSVGYMAEDPRFSRFFAYLSLFFSAMLTLVLADHLLLLYMGWEGVGLCSYLLISFWFERPSAAYAGKKAFLTTRVGDLGLLAAILLIARVTGDLSFTHLQSRAAALGPWAGLTALLIFWGAAGKSAQFPLHVWLPDAMEGPTPVSALIHAATMVAAGVYLVARTLPLFLVSQSSMLIVATIGGMTSFFAATIACTETDLKRILAYSTISQLGLMMLALGCGSSSAGMFHLVTHAWFKALLFLGAGSVIHRLHHQEITRMGGLWKLMPVTALTFTIGAVAMAGIPPLAGFWSKEEILNSIAQFSHPRFPASGEVFLILALATSLLTAFYISRAVILTFLGRPKEKSHAYESPLVMTGPLVLLSLGAIFAGWIGAPITGHWFQYFLGAKVHLDSHGPEWIQSASVLVASAGTGLALLRYGLGMRLLPAGLGEILRPIYQLVSHKYYIDEIYEALIVKPLSTLARNAFSFDARVIDAVVNGTGLMALRLSAFKGWIDENIVDGLVNGAAVTVGRAGATLRLIQTGLVQNYLLIAAAGAMTLFLVLR